MGSALMTNMGEDATPKTKLVTFARSETLMVIDTGIGTCFKREVNMHVAKWQLQSTLDGEYKSQTPTCIFFIELPTKVWKPKVPFKYVPHDYSDDINEKIIDYEVYGNTVFRPKEK